MAPPETDSLALITPEPLSVRLAASCWSHSLLLLLLLLLLPLCQHNHIGSLAKVTAMPITSFYPFLQNLTIYWSHGTALPRYLSDYKK
jgi:hypothetical protein